MIEGAHITGPLDLGCGTLTPFLFNNCTFDSQPILNDANAEFVGFVDCRLPGLSANRLNCNGPIWLYHSEFSESVILEDAQAVDLDAHNVILKTANPKKSVFIVNGMRVEHDIDLSECQINGIMAARSCHVKGSFVLAKSTLNPGIGPAFFAKLLRVGGDLLCNDSVINGRFDIEGSQIDGTAVFVNAKIGADKDWSIDLDHSVIKLGVHASNLVATGTVSLHHAIVSCQISLTRATITTSDECAIRADHAVIQGSLVINGGLKANAPIMLHGAQIDCGLNMWGLEIELEKAGRIAIEADDAKIGGDVLASVKNVAGTLLLDSAKIGGRVTIGGKWSKPFSGKSIILDRTTINSLDSTKGLSCEGAISIAEATVNGPIDLGDSSVGFSAGKSIDIGGSHVKGDVIAHRATLTGVFDAPQAVIDGDLRLADSQLLGTPAQDASRGTPVDQRRGGHWRGASLRLRGAHVLGDVDLRGTTISHKLELATSTVGQIVNLDGAALGAQDGNALVTTNSRINQLRLQLRENPKQPFDLRHAQVEILTDSEKSWPPAGSTNIEGLQYRRIDSNLTSNERLKWLAAATSTFSPQPYEQLASMYRARGNADEEREVKLQATKRMFEARGNWQRGWGFLQNVAVGYGYRPSRAVFWIVGLWLVGTLWFAFGSGTCSYGGIDHTGACPVSSTNLPTWNPALLSIDLLSPFAAFGQDNAWRLTGISAWVAVFLTLAGWVLITTIAAAVARTLKH
ncbi:MULTISPECIES: hypothetical protein [Mycolicibacterium]|uniref:hypothetical protein n=1 Tax=Mycolicibacterium TaxID=1866885 RepID=UPI0010421637|nr:MULTISPECIES: hypothetical protein [Mycolicibacterium]MCW1820547.1 hypothetical protein [Mycolicibacterium senegalense]